MTVKTPKTSKTQKMTDITAHAIRENGWWVADFTCDGKEYGTQAKRLDQLMDMVKDASALMTGRPEDTFDVHIVVDMAEYISEVEKYKEAAAQARDAEAKVAAASRSAVAKLKKANLGVRDIATLMGVSPQRVSQLSHA